MSRGGAWGAASPLARAARCAAGRRVIGVATRRAASLLMLRAVTPQVRCARSGCLCDPAQLEQVCAAVRLAGKSASARQGGGTHVRRAPAAAPRPVRACIGPQDVKNAAQLLDASLPAAAAEAQRVSKPHASASRAVLTPAWFAPLCRRASERDRLCGLRKVRHTSAQSCRLSRSEAGRSSVVGRATRSRHT